MIVNKYKGSPILKPEYNRSWMMQAVFNGCPIRKGNDIYLLYRALSSNYYHTYSKQIMQLSTIGIAKSKDGKKFYGRKKFIYPRNEWERFGCEDPRITKLGDKYYIFYTALSEHPFRASGIKVAVAVSKDLESIEEKHLVTPFNAKAMALFPEKINGKIWTIFSFHTDDPPTKICLAPFSDVKEMWSEDYWSKWLKVHEKYVLNLKRCERDHVEVGSPPLKTKHGWLLFYSYIKDYFSQHPVFGIEAVLLDLKNPTKIIARTDGAILVPQEYYERQGMVPNIIFPSGALMEDKKIYLYYGSADTTCSLAFIDPPSLFDEILQKDRLRNLSFKRSDQNPIISPNPANKWESKATFNPAAIYLDGQVHLVYRGMSDDNTSVMGYATSKDGITIDYRCPEPIYVPRENFEKKINANANSGCEDPRLTLIDDKIHMMYTAYDSLNPPRVALTTINKKDFLEHNWNWSKPELVSPPNTNNKDACIFPEKIKGKYYILHRNGDGIDLAPYSNLEFEGDDYLEETMWMEPRKGWWDSKRIGTAAPPIKTEQGWLVLYHGIKEDNSYHLGAFLLDLNDPFIVLAKLNNPILSPETEYEKNGIVPNVVFPCGAVVIKKDLYIYYGGADKVVGVASIKLRDILDKLYGCRCEEWKK